MSDSGGEIEFVNVRVHDAIDQNVSAKGGASAFYDEWLERASAKHSSPELFGADALRQLYPKHSLVMSDDPRAMGILSFPGVMAFPLDESQLVTNLYFVPLARRLGAVQGVLLDSIEFGSFQLAFGNQEFILHVVLWQAGFMKTTQLFLLHEGPQASSRELLLKVFLWADDLHDEIWVFDMGFWRKDHDIWSQIQKADWKDIILKDNFKKELQKDVYGFFASEDIYKELAIPWKRGLILLGPPGNGKTITIKVIMKTCDEAGFKPLYVKSFQSWKGDEGGISDVFDKARQMSPCVVVLEDLDSLITDRNRSFFLNQLDGLEGNDGLLVIGTTNHFERLDPSLSSRPSRFDRKYLFDDPDREERTLYTKYWQDKLKKNKEISFPDTLVEDVADRTHGFSFAYLKEAFVSSLVRLAGIETDKPSFSVILLDQIKSLRKQLDKAANAILRAPRLPEPADGNDIRPPFDTPSDSFAKRNIQQSRLAGRYYTPAGVGTRDSKAKSEMHSDFRLLLDQLSTRPQSNFDLPSRIFTGRLQSPTALGAGERQQTSRLDSGSALNSDGISGRNYGGSSNPEIIRGRSIVPDGNVEMRLNKLEAMFKNLS